MFIFSWKAEYLAFLCCYYCFLVKYGLNIRKSSKRSLMCKRRVWGKIICALKSQLSWTSFKSLIHVSWQSWKKCKEAKISTYLYCFFVTLFSFFSVIYIKKWSLDEKKIDGPFIQSEMATSHCFIMFIALCFLISVGKEGHSCQMESSKCFFLLNASLTVYYIPNRYLQRSSKTKCNFTSLYQPRTQESFLCYCFFFQETSSDNK